MLQVLLGLDISGKQIQRVSEYYGDKIEEIEQQDDEKQVLALKNPREAVYIMFDGGMVLTRENDWMEMKVGRAFSQSSCVSVQPERNEIIHSDYVCHLGGSKDFLKKWERHIEAYNNKIFIADGAKWIWNYVEDAYPQSIQILDFFHAVEKLGCYANARYPMDAEYRKEWLHLQKQRLLNNGIADIIKELEQATTHSDEALQALKEVLGYYKNNESRMHYQSYLQAGYLIGSGAMEAAHRNVVQQRLKLSGQRWSVDGAQKIVNLRAYKKSKQWHRVETLIKTAA